MFKKILYIALVIGISVYSGIYGYKFFNQFNYDSDIKSVVLYDARNLKNEKEYRPYIFKIKKGEAFLTLNNIPSRIGSPEYVMIYQNYDLSIENNDKAVYKTVIIYFESDLVKKYESTVETMTFIVKNGNEVISGCYKIASSNKCYETESYIMNSLLQVVPSESYTELSDQKYKISLDYMVKPYGGLVFGISGYVSDPIHAFEY